VTPPGLVGDGKGVFPIPTGGGGASPGAAAPVLPVVPVLPLPGAPGFEPLAGAVVVVVGDPVGPVVEDPEPPVPGRDDDAPPPWVGEDRCVVWLTGLVIGVHPAS
jgi:hypothetical protein